MSDNTPYEEQCRDIGLKTIVGVPNFILIEVGERAAAIRDDLKKKRILVQSASAWNLPQHIRVSYGREHENEAFFAELKNLV